MSCFSAEPTRMSAITTARQPSRYMNVCRSVGLPGARLSISVWLGLSGPWSIPYKAVRELWAQGRPRVRWGKGVSQGSARLL